MVLLQINQQLVSHECSSSNSWFYSSTSSREFTFIRSKRVLIIEEYVDPAIEQAQLGIKAFADGLLVVPKTLAENSGLVTQDVIIDLTGEHGRGNIIRLNRSIGEPIDPQIDGIFDNYAVKRQIINLGQFISTWIGIWHEILPFVLEAAQQPEEDMIVACTQPRRVAAMSIMLSC